MRQERFEILERPGIVADVSVPIDEPRRNIKPAGIENFGCFTPRVLRAGSYIADSAAVDSDFKTLQHFSRMHIDQFAAGNNEVGMISPNAARIMCCNSAFVRDIVAS